MENLDWRWLGWTWVVLLALIGIGLLIFSGISAEEPVLDKGLGTALQLVAAGILFSAVFPSLMGYRNSLIPVAGLVAAIFGYVGTMMALLEQNDILFGRVIAATFQAFASSLAVVTVAWLMRFFWSTVQ